MFCIRKIAIAIADSDLYDNTVKIGLHYRPSDNPDISKKRLEKYLDSRLKLIKGIKTAETKIPDYNKVIINVVVDSSADRDRIYKIINNLLPMPDENKKIILTDN